MLDSLLLIDCISLLVTLTLSFLILNQSQKQLKDYLLAGTFVSVALLIVCDNLLGDSVLGYFIFLFIQSIHLQSLYFYFSVHLNQLKRKIHPLHIIYALFNVLFIVLSIIYQWGDDFYETNMYFIHLYINFISQLAYAILMTFKIVQLNMLLKQFPHKVNWFNLLFAGTLLSLLVNASYMFLYSVADESWWLWAIDSFCTLTILSVWGIKGFQWRMLYQSTEVQLEEDKWKRLFQQMDQKIQEEQLYLNPHLKIADLAQELKTNERYISKAINSIYNDSYTNFLNDYRLMEFKKRVVGENQKQYNLDAIAISCGFSSKSAFYRFFKLREGTTPFKYIKSFE